MQNFRRLGWGGLFALVPLAVAMIVLDDAAPFSRIWHFVLLGAIVVVICVLAVVWSERNSGLMEREGADALVGYCPLPGTIGAMGAQPPAQDSPKSGRERLVFGYDPLAFPPVANNRPDDAATESLS
jgi:hypothetical protein